VEITPHIAFLEEMHHSPRPNPPQNQERPPAPSCPNPSHQPKCHLGADFNMAALEKSLGLKIPGVRERSVSGICRVTTVMIAGSRTDTPNSCCCDC